MEQSAGIGEQLYPSCKERNFLPELRAAQVWSQAPRLSDRQRDALLEGLRTLGGLRNVVKVEWHQTVSCPPSISYLSLLIGNVSCH